MTREQIEKAAMLSCASKDEVLTDFGRNCFIEGAQWRINSVWHDKDEMPEKKRPLLVENRYQFSVKYKVHVMDYEPDWEENVSISRWAYISDLIPDGKEETK